MLITHFAAYLLHTTLVCIPLLAIPLRSAYHFGPYHFGPYHFGLHITSGHITSVCISLRSAYHFGPYHFGPYHFGPLYHFGPYHFGPLYHFGHHAMQCFQSRDERNSPAHATSLKDEGVPVMQSGECLQSKSMAAASSALCWAACGFHCN